MEERKVRLSEKASHMNLREHLIRNALNPTNRTSLHEEHPEGLLLVQARSGGELRGFYQKAAELRQLLTESLYAVYVRDAEAYFLLSKKELTQMVSRDCPDLEINVSRSFYDLASLRRRFVRFIRCICGGRICPDSGSSLMRRSRIRRVA